MKSSFFAVLSLAILSMPAIAQDKPNVPAKGNDIVVTGVRLQDSEKALKDCLARHCPPTEDIAATLAHAENQFVAGDYHDARKTLLSSVGRNKRFAKTYPVQVADLLRANSRIAAHLGESEGYRIGMVDVVTALKAGLPDSDPRVLVAQIEVGDSFARTRQIEAAVSSYRDVARRAHDLNLPIIEGHAKLRTAILYRALSDVQPSMYRNEARRSLDALIAIQDPKLSGFVLAAKLLKAQMAAKDGDAAAIDRLVADYRSAGGGSGTHPVLLFSPNIKQREMSDRATNGGSVTNQMATDNFDDQWVDISFWVAPNGKVTDAGVLRQSPKLAGYWVQPIVDSIAGRRYAPLAMDPTEPGVLRVERYTFTSRWTVVAGSHMRVREPTPQIEMIDLSQEPPAKTGG